MSKTADKTKEEALSSFFYTHTTKCKHFSSVFLDKLTKTNTPHSRAHTRIYIFTT